MASVQGLPELLNKLTDLGTEGHRMASAIVNVVGDNIVKQAKENAPVAFGKIRQGIIKDQIDSLRVVVNATAPESAYQEFGTGGKVDVPADMSEIASQFKGSGSGDFEAFIQALIDWIRLRGLTDTFSVATHKVSTKGSDEMTKEMAYMIARKILSQGLRPQPFLYPAFVAQSQKLMPMLEQALKELLKSKQG